MTTNHVRRYDVAISFLAEDERVAMSLATALKKHWTVFIYTERQKELAGTDGVEANARQRKKADQSCIHRRLLASKSADPGQRISSKQLADWCLQRLLDRDLPDRD